MAVFNLLLRLLSSWVLYIDWGDRWGYHAIITITISLHHHQARHPPAPDRDHGHQQERHQERGGQRAQRLRAHPLPRSHHAAVTEYRVIIMLQYGVQGHHNAAVQSTGSSIIILLHVQARPSCRPYLPATQSTTEVLPASQYLNQWCYFLVC